MTGGQFQLFQKYGSPTVLQQSAFHGRKRNYLLMLVVIILVLSLMLTFINVYEVHRLKLDHEIHHREIERMPVMEANDADQTYALKRKPVVWIENGIKSKDKYGGRSSTLKHVFNVFEKFGFTVGNQMSDWYVLWSHDYPFLIFKNEIKNLQPHQRVNHIPGTGYITNKVVLAQGNFNFIPTAFEIPARKKEFLQFSRQNEDMKWVQKSNKHRGIEVKHRDDVDFSKTGTFVQQYISNPFLIDGHKFDIGVYTIITSLGPTRVYFIDGEALFRFCPERYHPFDPHNLDKYVVGDAYLPLWQLPSLSGLYNENGFTFKNSFNEYIRTTGINPNIIWDKIKSVIMQVVLSKESDILKVLSKYTWKRSFFEMMRFDFVMDDKFEIFLMEANMSPNLSSDHFAENTRLYEHVIHNLLNVVGVSHFVSRANTTAMDYEDPILVSSQDIQVLPDFCSGEICKTSCLKLECKLCKKCLDIELEKDLKIAYLEHMRRGSARRIFPPAINHDDALKWTPSTPLPRNLNLKNKLMYLWFLGKCRLDSTWCQ